MIGIINTWSDMNPCHAHLRERPRQSSAASGRRGFPVELPAMSLGEGYVKPSSMLYRNFLAMEAEDCCAAIPSMALFSSGLRQDDTGPVDGRDQHEPAGDLLPGRLHRGCDFRGEAFRQWQRPVPLGA